MELFKFNDMFLNGAKGATMKAGMSLCMHCFQRKYIHNTWVIIK